MTWFCIFLADSCRVESCTLLRACLYATFIIHLSIFLWNWRLIACLFVASVLGSSLRIVYSLSGTTVVETWQLYIIDSLQIWIQMIRTCIELIVETIGQVRAQVAWVTAVVNLLLLLVSINSAYHDRRVLSSIRWNIDWVQRILLSIAFIHLSVRV